jgi:hypothetical protein
MRVAGVRYAIAEPSTIPQGYAPTKYLEQNMSQSKMVQMIKKYGHPSVAAEAA